MPVVVSLAWARLRHRPARWLLVALGVAVATMLPVLAESTATVVAAQALRYGVEELPPGDRSVVVLYPGLSLSPQDLGTLDQQARRSLADLTAGGVRVQMLSRQISDGAGGSFFFAATNQLPGAVRLTRGRMPSRCDPDRCEVVVLGTGTPSLDPALGIVVVGRAERTDPLLLTGSFDPGPGPVLLADGVSAAAQLRSLEVFQRTYAWVTPVDLNRVDELGVEGYLARSTRASLDLYRLRLSLTAPDQILRGEADRAHSSARRFALLGGSAMALLLGFAAIGAIGLRRDHAAAVGLLRRRGAGAPRTRVLTAIEAAVPVAAGTAVGLAAGFALAAWRAAATGLPATAAAGALRAAAPTVAFGALVATFVVAVTLATATRPDGGSVPRAWRAVDVTVVAGILIAGLALSRGAVTSAGLEDRTDPLLLALPIIFVVCGGLLVGRVWPVVTSTVARALPRRWLASRLGLLGAIRAPLRPVATAAFLAAAVGIVVFAATYQATLRRGAADQATFAVPLDVTVRTGQSLDRPLDVATVAGYAATAPGVSVHPVVRASANVRVNAAESRAVEVLGVDPDALPRIRSWDEVVGGPSAASLRRLLSGTGDGAHVTSPIPGIVVPSGARTLTASAGGNLADVDLAAWLRAPDGRDIGVPLRAGPNVLTADLPAALPDASRLFALTFTETSFAATRRLHQSGEGGNEAAVLTGRIALGVPRFTAPATTPGDPAAWAGWGSDGASVATGPSGLTVDYRLTGAEVVVRAAHDAPVAPLPVLTDARTAATAGSGLLQLSVGGGAPLAARIIGTAPRFPTTGDSFVVADARALADALDARDPGTGSVNELWLAAPPGQAATMIRNLAAPPFDRVALNVRQAIQDHLASDPLARGATGLLTGSAVLCLVVALVALVLLVVAERRDESAQLFAWESDGVAPRTLRLSLFLRAVAVVAVGVPGGVLIGLALSGVTTALVMVTAGGTAPVPPLTLSLSPLWTAVALGTGVAIGLAVCGGVAAAALRERLPRRPEEGLW